MPCSGWTPCSRYCPPLGTGWLCVPGGSLPHPLLHGGPWGPADGSPGDAGCGVMGAPLAASTPDSMSLCVRVCPHVSPCPSPAGAPPEAVPYPVTSLVQHLGHALPRPAPCPARWGGHGRAGTGTGDMGTGCGGGGVTHPSLHRLSPRWCVPAPGARGLCQCGGWCWGSWLGSCSSPSSSSSCGR